ILIPMIGVAFRVNEWREPVGNGERARTARRPRETHHAFAQLVQPEVRPVGTIPRNDEDVTITVNRWRRVGHPHAGASSGAVAVVGIAAPNRGEVVAGQLGDIEYYHPPGYTSLSFSAGESDYQAL